MNQRDESPVLDPREERELSAIEIALRGEAVDPDLEQFAELAIELRDMRPTPSQEFAAKLDAAAADGFTGPSAAGLRSSSAAGDGLDRAGAWFGRAIDGFARRPMIPAVATGLCALLVAGVVVIPGETGSKDPSVDDVALTSAGSSPDQGQTAIPESAAGQSGSAASSEDAAGASAGGSVSKPNAPSSAAPSVASDAAVAPTSQGKAAATDAGKRAVERDAQLTLGTDPEKVRDVTAKVISVVGAHEGIVLSSTVRDGSAGSAGASFSLLIPSAELTDALSDLSGIADLRSRQENALDITAPTVSATEHLRDAQAEVRGLLKQLAETTTDAERASVKIDLAYAHRKAARIESRLNKLERRANFSRVSVDVVTGSAASFGSTADDDWSLGDAAHDAVRVLSVAAGVILVSLALLAPLAMIGMLIWMVRRGTVRRGRERALDE